MIYRHLAVILQKAMAQQRSFVDHANLSNLPTELLEEKIFSQLGPKDLISLNRTNRHLRNVSHKPLQNIRRKQVQKELKRIFKSFEQPLAVGSQIKFIIDGEQTPRTGTIYESHFYEKSSVDNRFYCEHEIEVQDANTNEYFEFCFHINNYLETVKGYYFAAASDTIATIVNDDLVRAQHNYMELKQELVGAQLDFFSKEIKANTTLKIITKGQAKPIFVEVVSDKLSIERFTRTRYHHTTKVQYEYYQFPPPLRVIEFTIIDNLNAKLYVHDSGDFGDIVSIEPAPAPTYVPLKIPFGK